jgi:hypothetical protein
MTTTKAEAARTEKAEAIARLKTLLKPGKTVYTILRHRSASGMSRSISLVIAGKDGIQDITFWAARAMGYKMDASNSGMKVGGCGMDMGFHLVYHLGRVLFPKGFIPSKAGKRHGRNGTPADQRDTDGGYALNHDWL